MRLATRKKILYPIIALIIMGFVFFAWDYHMQASWDDHITRKLI